jgi:NAD(P)-dependent dehydrogenase (short-subunit alcohol dehydrogenase family)
MSKAKRSVLITGCSDGGTGAALAEAFHNSGLHVYATARNVKKMERLASLGIQTLELDVLSDSSIEQCVKGLDRLDILVNNAGAQYTMPLSDLSIPKAKALFDINVWAHIQVTQAFLPLLMNSESGGMIVNHTSSASVLHVPMQSTYNASKAAIAMFTGTLRLELQPLGIKVVDLRSGLIKTNIINNLRETKEGVLPEGSIYTPAKEAMEQILLQKNFEGQGMEASQWAKSVVSNLLRKNPSPQIWKGDGAWLAWLTTKLPFGLFDSALKKACGMDKAEPLLRK